MAMTGDPIDPGRPADGEPGIGESPVLYRMDGAALRAHLATPPLVADVQSVAARWRWATVSVLLDGRFDGLQGHDIARKVRGALWPVLTNRASEAARAGAPCPRQPASVLDLLWNPMGFIGPGREIPKPWVMRGSLSPPGPSGRRRAVVDLILFGHAADRVEEMLDVFVEVFGTSGGSSRHRASGWRLADSRAIVETGIEIDPVVPEAAVLAFLSPLKLGRDGAARKDCSTLLANLIDRVDGLARWQGCRLEAQFGPLKAQARSVVVEDSFLKDCRWQRRSANHDKPIPVDDRRGDLLLSGSLAPVLPFLRIGEVCHVGKDVRHGLGWFTLHPMG